MSATASHAVANEILRSDDFAVGAGDDLGPPWMNRLLARVLDVDAPGPIEAPSLLAVDPPQHARYRRPVAKVFSPRAINALRPRMREVADDLLDRLPPGAPFDLVAQYAKVFPLTVIAEVLGLPADLQPEALRAGDAGALLLDPALTLRQYRGAMLRIREAHEILGAHIDRLRHAPGPDLLSQLTQLDGTDRLSDLELRTTALLVIGAGFETTVNLIANAVVALLGHPAQLAALQADPAGWENAVEEVLRFDSPVQVTMRHATRGVTVGGVPVAAGRPVLVLLGGANRDPAVFDEPGRFDVTRPNAREHVAFSAGIHYCLGANLARIEAAIALEARFSRVPDLALAGAPRRRATRVLRGFDALPARAGARHAAV